MVLSLFLILLMKYHSGDNLVVYTSIQWVVSDTTQVQFGY